jgi:ubiquinone/menaquinone biosynthesis C-methylase UbiE
VRARDPKEVVASGYDAIVDRFDAWQERIRGDARARYLDELLQRLPRDADVLELGCGGGGASTQTLAARSRVVGVDISGEQIRRARERVPGATFIHADATTLELPPASFGRWASTQRNS